MWWFLLVPVVLLLLLAVYDLTQKRHAVLRNFPVVGHFRFLLERIGPELRQYVVAGNDEERPFSRDQRRWVYASSKKENPYFGFGTDADLELSAHHVIVKQAAFPLEAPAQGADQVPVAKVLGAARGRTHAFRPTSVVNVSAMSFGSLSGAALEALNRGALLAGALQNTGEGGISPVHQHGGELVFQIGTAYFGCRTPEGRFDLDRLVELCKRNPVRALEVKLSQGAKPGLGGVLPAAKVTSEIAAIRGVPAGQTCVSPSRHSAFSDVDSMLDFVELLAERTGLPVGIKSAVGDESFWVELARLMSRRDRGVDFVTVDGGEGGTGAAPLSFTDHVSLPFKVGFSRVYRTFAEAGLQHEVVFVGAGKLGFPDAALTALALGVDMVNVGREAMLSVGCIQAQKCHTGHCPVGVATQSPWLERGLDPTLKSVRAANYLSALRHELLALSHVCGVPHPSLVPASSLEVLDGRFGSATLADLFGYPSGLGLPSAADDAAIRAVMADLSAPERSLSTPAGSPLPSFRDPTDGATPPDSRL